MNESKNLQLQSIDEEIIHENLWFAVNQINTLKAQSNHSDRTLEVIKDYILDLDRSLYTTDDEEDINMIDGFATHIIGVLGELEADE